MPVELESLSLSSKLLMHISSRYIRDYSSRMLHLKIKMQLYTPEINPLFTNMKVDEGGEFNIELSVSFVKNKR